MISKLEADLLVAKHETFYRKDLEMDGVKVFIYNYLLSDKEAFKDDKATELRGLTITHENAKERTFLSCPKFFNINEVPGNEEANLRLKKIKKVQDKADGSLIQFIQINGDTFAKSKQSFTNDQAKSAQSIYDESAELKFFIHDCWGNNFHPLFELIGPSNQVVLEYPEDELVLIAVRNDDGEFIDVNKFNYKYTVDSYDITLDEILDSAKNDTDREGYIIKFTDGNIVKVKTLDYLEKHRLTDESNSYKIILKRILEENMDDIMQVITKEKREKIKKLEQPLDDYVTHFTQQIYDIIQSAPESRKEVALKNKGHLYFSVIMSNLHEAEMEDIKDSLIQSILKKNSKEKSAKEFFDSIQKG